MPDIPTSSTVGWLPGRYYATGRCLWDRVKVREFILWGPAARDCGIGGGPADWGQHQGGVHSGDKLCPTPDTRLSSLVHYSHNLEMYSQDLHQFVANDWRRKLTLTSRQQWYHEGIVSTPIHPTFDLFQLQRKRVYFLNVVWRFQSFTEWKTNVKRTKFNLFSTQVLLYNIPVWFFKTRLIFISPKLQPDFLSLETFGFKFHFFLE